MKTTHRAVIGGKKFLLYEDSIKYMPSYGKTDDSIYGAVLAEKAAVSIKGKAYLFAKDTEIGFFYETGNVASGCPEKDTEITLAKQPYRFRQGMRILFFKSGNVDEGYLAQDTEIKINAGTIILRKGTKEGEEVKFYESGSIEQGYLAHDTELPVGKHKYLFRGFLGLSESGAVTYGFLGRQEKVGVGAYSVPFIANPYHGISFFDSGEVSGGYIAEELTADLGGITAILAYGINFSDKGKIVRAILAAELPYADRIFSANDTIECAYDSKGNLTGITKYKYPER